MKIDLEMLRAMVANGATGAMVLAMVEIQCERYEALRLIRRPIESASKRRTRSGQARTEVDSGGHEVDIGRTSVDFDEFWKFYPKRMGANPKAPAEKLFLAAIKSGARSEDIISGARACAIAEGNKVGTEFIPQAVKWLRDRRWQDYSTTSEPEATIDWDQVLTTYKKIGHWSKWAGPGLDSPACRAPREMLEKYGIIRVAEPVSAPPEMRATA